MSDGPEPTAAVPGGWAGGRRRVARLPVLVAVVGLLALGGVVDRTRPGPSVVGGPALRPMPVAAPADALSSTWFCAGALNLSPAVATGSVVVANALDRPLDGTITLLGASGQSSASPFTVSPRARLAITEAAAASWPFVGAEVTLHGGAAAVEQVVTGGVGTSAVACATAASEHWYFADGTTQARAGLVLSLLNPFSDDAIVDLSFVTEQGVEAPADFQGIVVPARSVAGIDVGSHLRLRAQVATAVSVRSGRVVAFKTQIVPAATASAGNTSGGTSPTASATPPRPPGMSLVLGSPSLGTEWWWPEGMDNDGAIERYRIFNPGPAEADVTMSLVLDQGSADPFVVKVAPGSTATITSNDETRIPKGVGHAVALHSTNGVGIVAERTLDVSSPASPPGLADVLGSRLSARRWLLAAGEADATTDEWVIIDDPGSEPATVSITALAAGSSPVPGLTSVREAPGQRLVAHLNGHVPSSGAALEVDSSEPVIVERDLRQLKGIGIDATIGVPLGS